MTTLAPELGQPRQEATSAPARESLDRYLDEIGRYRLLTAAQEATLAKR